jgi:hypothetical protein
MLTLLLHLPNQAQITKVQVPVILFLLVYKTLEGIGWAALSCDRRVDRFQDCRLLYRLARIAMLCLRIGRSVNTAGVQLTHGDTDCAGTLLQCVGVVLKGVRQCAALRPEQ